MNARRQFFQYSCFTLACLALAQNVGALTLNTGSKAPTNRRQPKPVRFGVSRSGTDERPNLDRESTATYENEIRATLMASMLKRESILASNRQVV